ncbi:conserved exported hypothetical protein [Nitrospina gracilis 3/211]|uniref:Sulfatase-modifying factor enzyme-like domain-containing protein n=1 Tax=Nitrospina gracilis (strain 3/211) TaxID=1266370 RepID=M1YY25_NITG3|nr:MULTISPECIES: formylglycine-generating enzyme family protein [Nitrospina]MCF8723516.1 formylglycine-generating enzyme required for sulfatase activity [Nitrospina sp. Nb-3]CCQ90587.1 conserved exported hypothetical protein [Nitrospina gracilis 3/211]
MKTAVRFLMAWSAWLCFAATASSAEFDDPSMVLIPEGQFVMGSGKAEDEPPHTVHLSAYYIDKHEVTQLQFEAVMDDNPSNFESPNHPVEQVTWYEARDYCLQVGKRLPTEAEWEKAARAGTSTIFYWGDAIDGDHAWYWDNSGKTTHPVGQKKPNPLGLFDAAGNVWEWVLDNYSDTYYTESPKRDPKGPFDGKYRSIRGGSWRDLEQTLRATRRNYELAAGRFDHIGFRCVREVE